MHIHLISTRQIKPNAQSPCVNYQNDSLAFCVCSGRKRLGLELSGPPTVPLLGQLEHLTALRERVGQDGRP